MTVLLLAAFLAQQPLAVTDVQREVAAVLAGTPCPYDVNGDGSCDVTDVQAMIDDIVTLAAGCTSFSVAVFGCLPPLSADSCTPGVQFTQVQTACYD